MRNVGVHQCLSGHLLWILLYRRSLPPKRRRRHSPQFKAEVLTACAEPGNTIAGVAQRYHLNANLVHKWRRQLQSDSASGFVRLPEPVSSESESGGDTVRIELHGNIVVHWPIARMADALVWLRAMRP